MPVDFNQLYREYRDRISRMTYYYTKNPDDREELVQEIFYQIYTALPSFQSRSRLSTFIWGIARNTAFNHIRKSVSDKKKQNELLKYHSVRYEKDPLDILTEDQDYRYFKELVDRLPEENREPFYLSEVEGLKYRQIADLLKIPVGTVKSRISRAKEKIMEWVREDEDE